MSVARASPLPDPTGIGEAALWPLDPKPSLCHCLTLAMTDWSCLAPILPEHTLPVRSCYFCLAVPLHMASHGPSAYSAALQARPPRRCWCSWLLSHLVSSSSSECHEFDMHCLGFFGGRTPVQSLLGVTKPYMHMSPITAPTPGLSAKSTICGTCHESAYAGCSKENIDPPAFQHLA